MPKSSNAGLIDLQNLPEGGGGSKFKVPEGDYPFKVKSVALATSQSGNKMFVWEFVGTDGKVKGKVLKEYTSLNPNALWKLRDVIEAITGRLPGAADAKKLLAYCKKLVGKPVGITLEDDEYTNDKGKTSISSKASDFVNIDDLDASPEDDDEDVDDEDDEDVEDEDGDEFDDMDRAALKKHIKDEELDIAVKKSMSDDDLREAIRELTDDEDEDEDEDEDDDDDGLDEMDRAELKAHIKSEKLDIGVKKSMSDDDIRDAIRAASDSDDDDDEEEVEDVDLDEL